MTSPADDRESKASLQATRSPLLRPITAQPIFELPMAAPLRKLVIELAEDPERALRKRRRSARLTQRYFDLCDANALECERGALEQPELVLGPARLAVRLAEKRGDPHLVRRGLGVLAHAHLAVEQPVEALAVLESYRLEALRCCRPCKSEWLHRYGDYLVEIRDGPKARRTLGRSLRAAEGIEEAGRIGFVHGISHHYLGQRAAALEDELHVLESLDLASPRGYFLDALAMLAVFLRGASPREDRRVLRRLGHFRSRIQGVRDFTVVRVRLRWVEGLLLARLGRIDPAVRRLDGVRRHLLEHGAMRSAVAVTLDLGQIYCRREYGENGRTVLTMLHACLRRLPAAGEEAMLSAGLRAAIRIVERRPEDLALDALVGLRGSFVVPVPGIVSERLGGGREKPSSWCRRPGAGAD